MIYRKELEHLVQQVLNEKGLSFRGAGRSTGLHHTTIMELSKGDARSRVTLIKFARGMEISPNAVLDAAGYGTQAVVTREELAQELRQIGKRLEALAQLIVEVE